MAVDNHRPNISFRREGNLFLVDNTGKDTAKASVSLQKSLGCRVEWWTPETIKKRCPLYTLDKLAGGTFGPLDGHFDAYAFLMGYKSKARSLGAHYIKNRVTEILSTGARVTGVKLASGESLSAGYVLNWPVHGLQRSHVRPT